MLRKRPVRMAQLSTVVELPYGLLAICRWVEEPGKSIPAGGFALYSFGSALALIAAYRILDRADQISLKMQRWKAVLVGLFAAGLFALGSVADKPVSILIFPLLMLAVFVPLRRNRSQTEEGYVFHLFPGKVRGVNYWLILLIPLSASLLYWLAQMLGMQFPTKWVVYLITAPAGFFPLLPACLENLAPPPAGYLRYCRANCSGEAAGVKWYTEWCAAEKQPAGLIEIGE
ncbi:MAG: hypothetical protein JXA25_14335 [Anaerolineales bacterium]|nr:hypothetical protein [Anaerolineales bacterium]